VTARLLAFASLLAALGCGGSDATAVSTGRVERAAVLQSIVTGSGEIVAARYADIGANVMGRIVELAVREGDRVQAGQVLARIDPVQASAAAEAADAAVDASDADARAADSQVRAAQAALDEAQALAAEAASSLTRAEQLRDAGLLPAAEFDRTKATAAAAQAQAASARAALDRARQNAAGSDRRTRQARAERAQARDQLSKTAITAPISGVVTRLDVELGEMVVIGVQNQPGTILMTISDLSSVNAEVKVAEADVVRLATGQPASVSIEGLPGRKFAGRIIEMGASALPQLGQQASAREFRVRVRLDEAAAELRPGFTCDADIIASERTNVLTVPLQAAVERSGRSGVFRITGDTVAFTPVTTGIIGGLSIEVEGIDEGTTIVTGPIQALRSLADGAAVRAVEPRQ
jgi:HlyD family secretion protein